MALIEVSGLGVSFQGLTALANVSFSLEAGTVCALIGPNGAGKTTLFNAISGYVRPRTGKVVMDGWDITGLRAHQVALAGLRRTFQNGGVFPNLTVLENVLCGLHRTTKSSFAGLAAGWVSDRRAEREATEHAYAMLDRKGLSAMAQREAGELSFGQQRLVEICRALISKPRALCLDEPAVGLSAAERDGLVEDLRALAAEGVAILLVEHVLDLVMAVSDRVLVLNYGELIAQGTPAEVRADPAVLEAYLGHG